ncbi:lipoprotein-releasing ABC transporter permease subunit [Shewanella marina]|uniref:lipoprotein-releasing ABC transporter permease subunit n=1 Tax=Shewanella marina TaxID=487319 RepID=UPI00046F1CDC|nr:lipoprotein-releasing ABC transporter permease subunit [Shewanella marina]
MLGFSFFIGYRYWRARKTNGFASFITIFSVMGIFLGVAALIVVSSVMNGLEGQLKQRILGAVPQLVVHSQQNLNNWAKDSQSLSHIQGIKGAVPTVGTQAMVQSPANIAAVQVYGVMPEQSDMFSMVAKHSYPGAFDTLTSGKYNVLIGSELARRLEVKVGDRIRLLSGDGVVYSPIGPVPSQRKFTVSGIFEMGSQVDAGLAYINYQDAQRLMRQKVGEVHELRLYLDDPFMASTLAPQVKAFFAEQGVKVTTDDWRESYGHLFAAVKMEKNMMSLMLSLIVAVAAFNIVSALVMMVVDKTSDIAVLKTQGVTTPAVMLIFIIQGSFNAIIGLILGIGAGVLTAFNLNGILSTLGVSILGVGQNLPVSVSINQLLWIIGGTLLMTLLATIYPALAAAKVQPAVVLRYE